MDRRTFIATAACSAIALPLKAQTTAPSALPVVGFLSSREAGESAAHAAAFRQGLREWGYVEGPNVDIQYRWGNGDYQRLPGLAKELVEMGVSAIIATGGAPSALAARAATATIPIVFVMGDDPVRLGLVRSLSRPGGNVTGVAFLTGELGAKRLGLICELVPGAGVVGLLLNPNNPRAGSQRRDVQKAAAVLGRRLVVLGARTDAEFAPSFASFTKERVGALVVESDPFFDSQRKRLLSLAARAAIPAIYHIREFPQAGGLMSYGASLLDAYRQVGTCAGRILKGEKPADLSVAQPTKFELVINLATAKALELPVPQSLLLRADEVIR
jgi:putative ABC transport system substrate-binding protein